MLAINESENAKSSASNQGKKGKSPKTVYGKTTFRLPYTMDWLLRHAAMQLELTGDPVCTQQQILELAMERVFEFLRTKKNVVFPENLFPIRTK